MVNFDSEFFSLVFPGLQAPQKINAQNSRPNLSALLSNVTFSNPFFNADFLLTGETKIHCDIGHDASIIGMIASAMPRCGELRSCNDALG